jgi:hypothetical protein
MGVCGEIPRAIAWVCANGYKVAGRNIVNGT